MDSGRSAFRGLESNRRVVAPYRSQMTCGHLSKVFSVDEHVRLQDPLFRSGKVTIRSPDQRWETALASLIISP
jgi:hypothetical protein